VRGRVFPDGDAIRCVFQLRVDGEEHQADRNIMLFPRTKPKTPWRNGITCMCVVDRLGALRPRNMKNVAVLF